MPQQEKVQDNPFFHLDYFLQATLILRRLKGHKLKRKWVSKWCLLDNGIKLKTVIELTWLWNRTVGLPPIYDVKL